MRATTSMSFSWGKGDLFVERMGEHVLGDLIPLRRMLDAGMIVGCGTDWGPKNVFEHVTLAETHEFAGSGRRNDGPAQRVTRAEALRMWTADAARAIGWAHVGTLAPGSHADLIVVDRDPLARAPHRARRTRRVGRRRSLTLIVGTLQGGAWTRTRPPDCARA
jgi:predicted amidohydrolase YtcJ